MFEFIVFINRFIYGKNLNVLFFIFRIQCHYININLSYLKLNL